MRRIPLALLPMMLVGLLVPAATSAHGAVVTSSSKMTEPDEEGTSYAVFDVEVTAGRPRPTG